jgi:hypothetical protein
VKRLAILTLSTALAIVAAFPSFGSQAGQQKKAAAVPPLLNVLQGFYIANLQQGLELTDEQFPRVSNLLREFVRDTYDIEGPRRNRALNQLRQAVNKGGSEEELSRLTKEYDQVYADGLAVRDKFFASVDPILQVSQRAKLRVYIFQKEQQVSHFIQLSQNPTGNNPAPPPSNPAPPAKPSPHQ